MNTRGQVAILGFMLGITAIVLILALAPVLKRSSDTARAMGNSTTLGLQCTNSSISDTQTATCITTDLTTSYWFWVGLGIAGILITAKFTGVIQ